jgi:hypothetical protein
MVKELVLVNIQGYRFAKLNFDKTGVVRIYGPNSAGKTAIFRPLLIMMENRLHILDERKSLINRDAAKRGDPCLFTVSFWNEYAITLKLAVEAAACEIKFTRPGGDIITRTLSDKILPSMLEEVQLHYDAKREVSLHYYRALTPPIITSTNGVTNYDILSEALADRKAKKAEENLGMLLKHWEETDKDLIQKAAVMEARMQSFAIIDEEITGERVKTLERLHRILSCIKVPSPKSVKVPTEIKLISHIKVDSLIANLNNFKVPGELNLRALQIVSKIKLPSCIKSAVGEYGEFLNEMREERCPTCGISITELLNGGVECNG